jgi:two-component system, LytTR family, sensor kinase
MTSSPSPNGRAPIDEVTAPRDRMHPVLVLFLVWTAVGVFFGLRRYVNALLFGTEFPDDFRPMILNLGDAYVWACLTPVIFRIAPRLPLSRGRWVRTLPLHVVVAIGIALFSTTLNTGMGWALWPDQPPNFQEYFRGGYYFNIQWYCVLTGVWYALDYYRRFRDREVAAAQLGARLSEARLEALKMQIQPHFLFNTLHSISELVHEDPDAADRMIIRLGDLLRLTVDNAETHEVTLAHEMDFLEAYLEIQQTRFQDTLEVEIHIPPELLDALVPNLVLQPLVENAIRHGVAARGGVGRVRVSARREGEWLWLEVSDNGAGIPATPAARGREGVGVRNTRARLEQMYGARQRFELRNGSRGGAVATVSIPFREAVAGADELHPLAVGAGA